MAERRMFAKTIIDSDAFLDMPISSQCLYFHLSMRADDDGFINNPKKIQRTVSCSEDDLTLLIAKKFIIPFQSGIVVIKHWKIHNYIQKDRYKATVYQEEKNMLGTKQNGSYKLLDTQCIQDVSSLEAQVSLGKDSLGEDNIYTAEKIIPIKPKPTEDKIIKPKDNTFKNKIEEYTNNENLRNTLNEFVLMRKTMKPGLTDYALKLLFTKLDKLSNGLDDLKIKILEQSIMSSYKGIFPIECGKNGKLNTVPKEPQTIQELMKEINKNGG